ncbi:MAG TPA: YfhO family protein [Thermoanaerobaculia bacterium]|nr:YfhO family protein [Thermoanaerobaculia bacterium]
MTFFLYLITTLAILALWHRMQRIALFAAIVLVLLPMLFTGRALLTNRVYAPIDLPFTYEPLKSAHPGVVAHDIALSDLHCQMIPWQQAVRHALSQGEWPLWNPFILCGDILAAAGQPAVYDPFQWIALLLPLPLALTFGASITFFLAGFFTFAFARALGRSELASLVAAAAFMFGGMMAFYAGWPLARTWAFLPFVLFGVRRVVHERRAGALLCALVLVIVSGHPESVLHVVAVGVAYGFFELRGFAVSRFRGTAQPRDRATAQPIFLALGAGVAALALTAVYLLPFFEAAPQTLEHEIRRTLYAPADYGNLISPERRLHRVGRTFLPYIDGQPWRGETKPQWDPLSARAGSIILALAVAALFVAPRRGETWFFFGLAVVCMSATFGSWPFAPLLHELPLFDIAINERLAFAAVLAMAMLAASAVDECSARLQPGDDRLKPVATSVVVVGVGIVLAVAMVWTRGAADASLVQLIALAELVPLALVAVLVRTRFAPAAILVLLLVQRTLVDGGIYPSLPRSMFYPRVAALDVLPRNEIYRIAGSGYTLIPNGAAMYGLEDVRGYEAMTFKRLTDTYPLWSRFQTAWFNVIDDPTRPFLSFLNVRYVLDGARVVENPNALPRAFLPRRIRIAAEGTVVEEMKHATDFSELAWVEVPEYEPHDGDNGPGRVTIRRNGLGYDLYADMEGEGWIVVSETAWKGWRLYVDGRRQDWRYANHAFLGVHVRAGRHHARLVYLPESFTRGRNISLATALLLIAGLIARAARRRRLLRRTPA